MKNEDIAYSILDLALVSQGSTIKQTLNNSLALAKEAEALGSAGSIGVPRLKGIFDGKTSAINQAFR